MARGALWPCDVTDAKAEAAEGAYETVVVGRSDHRVATVKVDCEGCAPALVLDVQLRHRAWYPRVILHVALDAVACRMWEARPVWPARAAAQAADWPRLAVAWGNLGQPPERQLAEGWACLFST